MKVYVAFSVQLDMGQQKQARDSFQHTYTEKSMQCTYTYLIHVCTVLTREATGHGTCTRKYWDDNIIMPCTGMYVGEGESSIGIRECVFVHAHVHVMYVSALEC